MKIIFLALGLLFSGGSFAADAPKCRGGKMYKIKRIELSAPPSQHTELLTISGLDNTNRPCGLGGTFKSADSCLKMAMYAQTSGLVFSIVNGNMCRVIVE